HGTYPFVTSSNTISGGACTGAGIAPTHIRDIWGVLKAYTTRVGEGPFPTELLDETGERLRRIGGEFGATTGRPRRCGWFDAVAAAYSCMVNGINKLAITKMDVLDQFEEIKICTAYELDGNKIDALPSSADELARVKPVYEIVPGWKADTTKCRDYNELPENAKKYLARIAELVDSKIAIISVGPKREQTFFA
ncbi:MAG: adenylosuccinate synthetase, partial [Victivallaceae bacterium]|nr:adenylosuccinate synthetase [Victivallaceae bacterium]